MISPAAAPFHYRELSGDERANATEEFLVDCAPALISSNDQGFSRRGHRASESTKCFMLNKPRVLIFHPALAPYRVDLFNSLSDAYRLRIVFLLDNLPDQKLDQSQLQRGLRAECAVLRSGFTYRGYKVRFGYGREIRRFQPDIVITSEFGTATMTAALRLGLTRRRIAHVIWTDDNPEFISSDPLIRRYVRSLALGRAAGLLVVSDEAATLYRDGFEFRKPIGSVPILQGDESFRHRLQAATTEAMSVADTYGLLGTRVVLFVGRLAPEKGLSQLLDCFVDVVRQMPDARLVLVGDGSERNRLIERARVLGVTDQVIFAGQAEGKRLLAWYRIGRVFVLPSMLERFGAVVNEALLAGLPVVCSRRAGARSLIRQNENGVVVDPMRPAELNRAMLHYLANAGPVCAASIGQVRASAMPIRFADSLSNFDSLVHAVWRTRIDKSKYV